jgi:hypothetical protein
MNLRSAVQNLAPALAGLCLGSVLAIFCVGQSSENKQQLTQKLKEFESLTSEQQSTIRKSYALLKSLPEQRQAEIESIYEQTQNDPDLQKTLDRYVEWRSALSQSERDVFRDLSNDDKIEFLKQRWSSALTHPYEITVEFSGPAAGRMPELHLSFEEFWKIISSTFPEPSRSEDLRRDLNALKSDKHRALSLALLMFESFQNENSFREMEARGELFRQAILENLQDKVWLARFREMIQDIERRPYARPYLFITLFTVLDKATISLGDDLRKQFPVSKEEIVDAFAALQNGSEESQALQRSLMTMTANDARKKLELLAQTGGDSSPESQLLARYNNFLQKRARYLRGPFGAGGQRPDSPRPRLPDEGDRSPRDQPRRRPGN